MKEPLITNMDLIQSVLKELYAKEPTTPELSEAVTKWEGLEQELKDWQKSLEPEVEL